MKFEKSKAAAKQAQAHADEASRQAEKARLALRKLEALTATEATPHGGFFHDQRSPVESNPAPEMTELEWAITRAVWGQRARVPAPSINADMNPQRIDANAAHVIKDAVMDAIDPIIRERENKAWERGFSERDKP